MNLTNVPRILALMVAMEQHFRFAIPRRPFAGRTPHAPQKMRGNSQLMQAKQRLVWHPNGGPWSANEVYGEGEIIRWSGADC